VQKSRENPLENILSIVSFVVRVVNFFKSDEKSDRSIDIFSTNQDAPFWIFFDKIDTPHLWKFWWISNVMIFKKEDLEEHFFCCSLK
jgi:hypothetical protein